MADTTITATHFRENLSAVLESVLLGKTVNVVRNGRPLCTLIPPAEDDAWETTRFLGQSHDPIRAQLGAEQVGGEEQTS
jgi:prevent-host-death family protein